MRRFWFGVLAAWTVVSTVDPARAAETVLICRLRQIGAGSATEFVRRLQIDGKAKTVAIADDVGKGFETLPQQGMLVRMDRSEVVFDYVDAVSLGESVIKWRDGTYRFKDGQFLISGSCVTALPDSSRGPRLGTWLASPHPP